jgi:hypothetical protein
MKSALISSVLFFAAGSASAADISLNNSTVNNSFNNVGDFAIVNSISFDLVVSQGARTCLPECKSAS